MIKCDKGLVAIKGTRLDLMSELTTIMNYMMEKEIIDENMLMDCVSLACLSKEEIRKSTLEVIDNMDDIGNAWALLQMMERQ